MHKLLLIATAFGASLVAVAQPGSAPLQKLHPDSRRNTSELVASRGYLCEEYDVETSDGYILQLFRIPCSKSGACGGPPVMMMHALLASSDEYVWDDANQSLAYVLADAGFDVWLPNKRGNIYNRRHKSLSIHSKEFWAFSWDDVGTLEIPEQIDFILRKTGYKTLGYVGHSEGTTVGFVAATNAAVAAKINAMVMLAPIANLTELLCPPLNILADLGQTLFYDIFGHKSWLSHNELLNSLAPETCHICPMCCIETMFYLVGKGDASNYDHSRLEVYFGRIPAGTSTMNMVHWLQAVRTTTLFQKYNFGKKSNLEHYGTEDVPQYDLSQLPMHVTLFSGDTDTFATPNVVKDLIATLPHDRYTLFNYPEYNHMDFVIGLDAKTKVYPQTIAALRSGVA